MRLEGADADGDGDRDLIAALREPSALTLLLNSEGGTFLLDLSVPLGFEPGGLAALDLDGDGAMDLAALDPRAGEVILLERRGEAAFVLDRRIKTGQWPSFLAAADLDGKGGPELVAASRVAARIEILANVARLPRSSDDNGNRVPDECEKPLFHRADSNGDGATDLTDGIHLLRYLFLGDAAPDCLESADADNNGELEITDGILIFEFLFIGGRRPADPGPSTVPCGSDPDRAGSAGDLGCAQYNGC